MNGTTTAPAIPASIHGQYSLAWFLAWAGIALSGGAFGLCLTIYLAISEGDPVAIPAGSIVGITAGVMFAALFGAPIVAIIATVSWILWITRFRRATPAFAGACTGMIVTAALFREASRGSEPWHLFVLAAGGFGAIGGYLPANWYWRTRVNRELLGANEPWQFSLGDLFVRFTVASALIFFWILIVRLLLAAK